MNVLVTGGTGYIGAHLVRLLAMRGDQVAVVDDVKTGNAHRIGAVPLVRLGLETDAAVDELIVALRKYQIDTVVHFAARKQVGESVSRPAWYYQQNIAGLANLLLAMEETKTRRFLFSSSAAVYASSDSPVTEVSPIGPVSPYGETKLAGEWLTRDATVAWPLNAVSLRYFNVAGAISSELGDAAIANLIPMVMEKIAAGESPLIFGDDYPTRDGTCIRDYIHVQDVAEAHVAAIDGMNSLDDGYHVFNVGTGRGASVREIIESVLNVAGARVVPTIAGRRAGDPAVVVANVDKIAHVLGWSSRFDLMDVIRSAWESRLP